MARIRSIHPGFYTDEDVVSVGVPARLMLIGLGVEADDKGVFPWKPTTIKMRLFPADTIDIAPLLEELSQANLVKKYEVDGRFYGAIRNFRKHQRPKSPNDIHPMPAKFRKYVGLTDAVSEMAKADERKLPKSRTRKKSPIPPKGEIAIQMEDGGEDVGGKDPDQEGIITEEIDRETGEIVPFAGGGA